MSSLQGHMWFSLMWFLLRPQQKQIMSMIVFCSTIITISQPYWLTIILYDVCQLSLYEQTDLSSMDQ